MILLQENMTICINICLAVYSKNVNQYSGGVGFKGAIYLCLFDYLCFAQILAKVLQVWFW